MSWDHPRSRGKDNFSNIPTSTALGSPPLTRERQIVSAEWQAVDRITPAHAGKTIALSISPFNQKDHPRSRGKDRFSTPDSPAVEGSPPLTRERRGVRRAILNNGRITPAHAGKTKKITGAHADEQDHPRSRGKDSKRSLYSSHYCRL